MQRSILIAIASAFTLSLMATAPASAAEMRFAERISYADLNLTNTSGADTVLNRIHHASRAACGGDQQRLIPLKQYRRERNCMRAFTSDAVADLGNPFVSARFAERQGRRGAFTAAEN